MHIINKLYIHISRCAQNMKHHFMHLPPTEKFNNNSDMKNNYSTITCLLLQLFYNLIVLFILIYL